MLSDPQRLPQGTYPGMRPPACMPREIVPGVHTPQEA